jgi:hypothetical protein
MIRITTVFHSLFSKQGAIQCSLNKGRWLRKTEKSKKAKRHEIDPPLNRVLRTEGVSKEARKRFVSLRDNIKIVKLTQTIIMLQSAPYRAYNEITLLRQRCEHFYKEMRP